MIQMIKSIVLFVGLFYGFHALAIPKVEIERVNGFEVHFVDVGQGDSYGVTFAVPFGTMNDTFEMMGRAHLLEHVMHIGTKKFPGYHTFDEKLAKAGVFTNAFTAGNMTFYYASGTQEHGELISQVMLSMLGGLEWNEEYFASERDVVINEIAVEYNKSDTDVSRMMGLTKLLPQSHPWNHALLGDAKSLKAMTIEDLKEFYYQIYNPSHVKVAIFGNFSSAELKAKARLWTQANLHPADVNQDSKGYRLGSRPSPIELVPSEFSSPGTAPESLNRLYIKADSIRTREILFGFEKSDFPKPEAIDLLVKYLSLNVPGSWLYKLQTELGWISQGYAYATNYKNRVQFEFGISLTEIGEKHRREITEVIFQAINSVKKGVDPELVELLKHSTLLDVEKDGRSVRSYMRTYGYSLVEGRTQAQQLEELKNLTAADLTYIANLFEVGQALYTDVGPAIEGMEFDSIFERNYKLIEQKSDLIKFEKELKAPGPAKFNPKLEKVELGQSVPADTPWFFQSKNMPNLKERMTLDLRKDLPDSAASVKFRLAPQDKSELLAMTLVWRALFERYRGQLNYLKLRYQTSISIDSPVNVLSLIAISEAGYATSALSWLIEKATTFIPTIEELERARHQLVDNAQNEYASKMSAQIAIDELTSKIDPLFLTYSDVVELGGVLNTQQVLEKWKRILQKSDKEYLLVGDLNSREIKGLKRSAQKLSPEFLDPVMRTKLDARSRLIEGQESHLLPFPLARSGASSYGVVRTYLGPKLLDLRESAAMIALNELTAELVGSYNRGDQGLGYIHRTISRSLDGMNHHFTFLGGVEGVENVNRTVAGWNLVMNNLINGVYPNEKVQDAIDSARNTLSEKKTSASDLLKEYSVNQGARFDSLASAKIVEILKDMSPQEVLQIAHKYVLGADKKFVEFKFGDCAQWL